MFDPLTSLSLAACVAQFIEFACKVCGEGATIFKKESSTKSLIVGYDQQHVSAHAEKIEQLRKRLRKDGSESLCAAELVIRSSTQRSNSYQAKALIDAAKASLAEAKKLQSILSNIRKHQQAAKAGPNASITKPGEAREVSRTKAKEAWLAATEALRTVWKLHAIRDSHKNLRRLRRELDSYALAIVNAKMYEQGECIVEILAVCQQLRSKTLRHTDDVVGASGTTAQHHTADTDFSRIVRPILDALHFRTINEREEVIDPAYRKTFDWIWKMPDNKSQGYTSFSKWLRPGTGIYWINGKAGSGKSTLMKYIRRHSQLRQCLQSWSGSHKQLMIASFFFFWRAGTKLQKTQGGLLRSLLFEALESRPDLVPVLFPELCRELATKGTRGLTLSCPELKKATSKLLSNIPSGSKLLLFIDGIDGYEGDIGEMLELFTVSEWRDSVKAIISSRPIAVCVDAFEDKPSMRLQDLTIRDIQRYVNGMFTTHKLMQLMESVPEGQGTTQQITKEITGKASGVFLWVYLVVKSLLEGLRNCDTRKQLIV